MIFPSEGRSLRQPVAARIWNLNCRVGSAGASPLSKTLFPGRRAGGQRTTGHQAADLMHSLKLERPIRHCGGVEVFTVLGSREFFAFVNCHRLVAIFATSRYRP